MEAPFFRVCRFEGGLGHVAPAVLLWKHWPEAFTRRSHSLLLGLRYLFGGCFCIVLFALLISPTCLFACMFIRLCLDLQWYHTYTFGFAALPGFQGSLFTTLPSLSLLLLVGFLRFPGKYVVENGYILVRPSCSLPSSPPPHHHFPLTSPTPSFLLPRSFPLLFHFFLPSLGSCSLPQLPWGSPSSLRSRGSPSLSFPFLSSFTSLPLLSPF